MGAGDVGREGSGRGFPRLSEFTIDACRAFCSVSSFYRDLFVPDTGSDIVIKRRWISFVFGGSA